MDSIKSFLLVFAGGGAGSLLRYLVWKYTTAPVQLIPFGTLFSNISSCLIAGFILGLGEQKIPLSPEVRLLLLTGFCGGFSTFSAFSAETLEILRSGAWANGFLNIGLNL